MSADTIQNNPYDELIRISKINSEKSINKELNKKGDLFFTSIFSHLRSNLLEWLPFTANDKVLEVGNGYGIFANKISTRVSHYVCIDNCKESIQVAMNRVQNKENVQILETDEKYSILQDLSDKFDYIIFSDAMLLEQDRPISECSVVKRLNICKKLLSKKGSLIFWSNNKTGLKYWSGCKDEVTDCVFSGLAGYKHKHGMGVPDQASIARIIEHLSLLHNAIYYPYPDYKFPTSIYSKKHLPRVGELAKNSFSWEKRTVLFNEQDVYNTIIENDNFPFFTNSFLVLLSNEKLSHLNTFTKYSNDRGEALSIKTVIAPDDKNDLLIIKQGMSKKATQHIHNMKRWYKSLVQIYENEFLTINKIIDTPQGIAFEHVAGEPLQQRLANHLRYDNYAAFEQEVTRFADILIEKSTEPFYLTPEFSTIFQSTKDFKGLKCGDISNIDLIFSNVIVNEDKMVMIDYEWVFEFPIPVNFILFRSIFHLFHGPRGESTFNPLYQRKIFEKLDINIEQIEEFKKMEEGFQRYVCGKHEPLRTMGSQKPYSYADKRMQVFYSYGQKFNNKDYFAIPYNLQEKQIHQIVIPIMPTVKKIRWDPAEAPCIVKINHIVENGNDKFEGDFEIRNGEFLSENILFFHNHDPQIIFDIVKVNTYALKCTFEIVYLTEEIAEILTNFQKNVM